MKTFEPIKTKLGLWRLATVADIPRLVELHDEQQKRVGFRWDFTNPFLTPNLITVVYERDGKVRWTIGFEAVPEMGAYAGETLPLEEFEEVQAALAENLRGLGFKLARVFAPSAMVRTEKKKERALTRLLKRVGFTMENDLLQQFYRKL